MQSKKSHVFLIYYAFLILNFAFYFIVIKPDISVALYQAGLGLIGAKAYEWGGQLWFLPALFVCTILYYVISSSFASKWKYWTVACFFLCFGLSEVSNRYCTDIGWNYVPYCISFCLRHMVWYALGDVYYQFLATNKKKWVACSMRIAEGIGIAVLMLTYLNTDISISGQIVGKIWEYLKIIMLIFGSIAIAKLMSCISVISKHAKDTLYLCGNEVLVKNGFEYILTGISLHYVPNGEFGAIIYCLMLFAIVFKLLIPFEKPLLQALQQKLITSLPAAEKN